MGEIRGVCSFAASAHLWHPHVCGTGSISNICEIRNRRLLTRIPQAA